MSIGRNLFFHDDSEFSGDDPDFSSDDPDSLVFEPHADITAEEVAQILPILVASGVLNGANAASMMTAKGKIHHSLKGLVDDLPNATKRHFR